LFRCRDITRTLPRISRFLGRDWSSNGDFLTPAIGTQLMCSPTRGPTITSAIDFNDGAVKGPGGRSACFWVQAGGSPRVALPYLIKEGDHVLKWFGARDFLDHLNAALRDENPLKFVMPWFGQACDAANGRMSLRRRWLGVLGPRELYL